MLLVFRSFGIRAGDLDRVIQLTENGASIDTFDANGWSPLHIAATRANGDVLRYLFCQFPDIEIRGKQMNQDTPLSFAALNGQADSIESLVEFGANIHARNNCNYTPIMIAANEGHNVVVQTLVEFGANPNDEAGFSGSALLLASGARKERLPTLRALINGGANINPPHPNGLTPMHKIAEWGGADEMAYLLEQGSKADARQWDGNTPLIIAIQKSNRECVRLLLDSGACRNTVIEDNCRPIHYAANCPNWQIMRMLLEKGDVELNAQTKSQGNTALHMAYAAENMTVVKILLHAGADPNLEDVHGRLPVQLLVSQSGQGSPSVVSEIIG